MGAGLLLCLSNFITQRSNNQGDWILVDIAHFLLIKHVIPNFHLQVTLLTNSLIYWQISTSPSPKWYVCIKDIILVIILSYISNKDPVKNVIFNDFSLHFFFLKKIFSHNYYSCYISGTSDNAIVHDILKLNLFTILPINDIREILQMLLRNRGRKAFHFAPIFLRTLIQEPGLSNLRRAEIPGWHESFRVKWTHGEYYEKNDGIHTCV